MIWYMFVPEEVLILLFFLFRRARNIYRFARVRVDAGVEHRSGEGHGRRREVLYLLRPLVHFLRLVRQGLHIALGAPRVRGDEIRNKLLVETRLFVDTEEEVSEPHIMGPCGLAHDL